VALGGQLSKPWRDRRAMMRPHRELWLGEGKSGQRRGKNQLERGKEGLCRRDRSDPPEPKLPIAVNKKRIVHQMLIAAERECQGESRRGKNTTDQKKRRWSESSQGPQ